MGARVLLTSAGPHGEEVVEIDGPVGTISGVLHPPLGAATGICLIMLTSGMQNRVGPGRVYLTAARKLASDGFSVLRIDLTGAGDSVCDASASHFDCHNPDEVDAAIDYVKERVRPRAIVLQGLCAGARVAMKASRNESVDGILAWSVPIFSASMTMPQSPDEPKDRISGAVAEADTKRLIRFLVTLRFLRVSWWRKQFPGGRGLGAEFERVVRSVYRFVARVDPKKHESPFLRAADRYLERGGKVLFVYGDLDQLSYREFRDRFEHIEQDGATDRGYVIVPGGTHTFSTRDAQDRAIALSSGWMSAQFGSATPA